MNTRRAFLVALALAFVGYTVWYYTRKPTIPPDVTFAVPGTGITVNFPVAEPAEEDLSLVFIDPDLPGANDKTKDVRAFQAGTGTIRGWSKVAGQYRFSVRVSYPDVKAAETERKLAADFIAAKFATGPFVTNRTVIDEARADMRDRMGRMILASRTDGRRMAVMFFLDDCRVVFLIVEGPADMTFESPAVHAFFGSVVFVPK